MFCTACGTKNAHEANYCKQCGHKLDRTAPPKLTEEEFAETRPLEDRIGELLALAFQKNEAGDLDAAVAACAEVLVLRPESTSAHSLMGMLYEKQGEREKAIAEFEKVLQLNPGSIADREKLDLLRDGTMHLPARKVISSHPQPRRTTLFDGPAGAAAAAVAVFLLALLLGAAWLWVQSNSRQTEAARIGKDTLPLNSSTAIGANPTVQNPSPINPNPPQNMASAPQTDPNAIFNPWLSAPPASSAPQDNAPRRPRSSGPAPAEAPAVMPAPVNVPSAAPPERERGNGGVVRLPDSDLGQNEPGAPTAANTTPRPRDPGQINIVVSPNNAKGGKGSSDGSGATMDSRSRRAIAQQEQLKGNYRRAATEYIKALDGAGEDAATLHQQIALCYQRLDEKESAVSHYNDAIAAYKAQVSGSRNVDAANRGIKACEAGIKACQ